jgi:superfamily I DNA/RNA helicase
LTDHISLDRPEDGPARRAEKVSLCTLHASKGLEFAVVFITGCEEGLAPLSIAGMRSDAGEERRLFYVGMTRAKRRLFLVRAQKRMLYGQMLRLQPSRFLTDIEDRLKNHDRAQQYLLRKKDARDAEQLSLF